MHYDTNLAGDISEGDDLSKGHAVKEGLHDAVSDMTKYTVTATVLLLAAHFVLPQATRKRILKKVGL